MAFPTRRRVVTTALATAAAGTLLPLQRATANEAPATAPRARGPRPLPRAHAHNDYLHPRPLHDALARGFTSVEADIFLVDGELLVAHEATGLDPARTLSALYLDPLLARVRAHHGTVFPGDRTPVQLLIDIKTDGAAAYAELDRQLRRHRQMLTSFSGGRVRPGAVTAVVSGDRAARPPMEAQRTRYAFYDGRLEDLGTAATASFVPLISSSWTGTFGWLGAGPIPPAERDALRAITAAAHRAGQRVRFWATPDVPGPEREALWAELLAAGVDHLNSDDLTGLARFLRTHDRNAR
ncbi:MULTISPECIES: phosphatidylinositol-specific phospholipase C/glycerophosphodiester phosphodiesterase family protein [unclassified Streptomyces]|uniref:phosphatidylinositol-specific phospholipase C/glycerophosphodiester phosphodiesterase family protein n=1 Tax=unclassified Streptomyces TaxID=2593676 RepID=UPI002DD8BE24|nr:phosphatidylinositol-specific phospholipase C/glycerophosphodiester phosphodiesterase family protein [Streptomyces sp. NBC_01257]WRZ69366.1 phosphatidylinositol-specific phospholipase C/glycerophosphodiester phosphodiesterase family protein [Streptomyces sp. NBC_01257]WSU63302.1 phosphatidylinositol-specific phospholipase C/glycerophosphodiester phosphodiesterase family protein [Streptomyces sp. NBC_01104]